MPDLSVTYMGLKLRNPVIAASSSLSKSLDGVKRLADTGVGAIVLKSMFEEQIMAETEQVASHAQSAWHSEAMEYVQNMGMDLGPRDYLRVIEEAKKAVDTPIIASLNCFSTRWWADYAKKLEVAGADAIELNVSFVISDPRVGCSQVEDQYVSILEKVNDRVELPVAMKIGPMFSSPANIAYRLAGSGAAALVLFNRYYRFDIDLDKMGLVAGNPFSTPDELHLPLRWIGLLAGRIDCDMSATTGIHDWPDAVKMILVGATTVQVCSALYREGLGRATQIIDGISNWMKEKNYPSLEDLCGKLSQLRSADPDRFERLQYIKTFVGIE
ncbi:MAG: dihydroorotate dehydrogenase-like protein [Acidobacteria bacterium]|nr:dihydroorotate dehydrogenase-like protein [Acidobacteriota bacterium]